MVKTTQSPGRTHSKRVNFGFTPSLLSLPFQWVHPSAVTYEITLNHFFSLPLGKGKDLKGNGVSSRAEFCLCSHQIITIVWVLSGGGYSCQAAAHTALLPSTKLEKWGFLQVCFVGGLVLSTHSKQTARRALAPRPQGAQPGTQLAWQPQVETHSAPSSSVVVSMCKLKAHQVHKL